MRPSYWLVRNDRVSKRMFFYTVRIKTLFDDKEGGFYVVEGRLLPRLF